MEANENRKQNTGVPGYSTDDHQSAMLCSLCVQELHFGFEKMSKAEYAAIEGQSLFESTAISLLRVSLMLTTCMCPTLTSKESGL